jgi:hypothetical protein
MGASREEGQPILPVHGDGDSSRPEADTPRFVMILRCVGEVSSSP